MKRSLRPFCLLGGLVTALLCGCGGKPADKAAQTNDSSANELVIISPHGREIQYEFGRLFEDKYPGVKVKWLDQGGSADDLRFVKSQFAAKPQGGIGIDLFFGGGIESFLDLQEQGVLAKLGSTYGVPAELNGLPLRGVGDSWVGATLSGFGILYNKTIAARDNLPIPRTWADLGDPRLRNRITLADSRHSGSAHIPYELILQSEGWTKGWQTLTAMSGNARAFATSASQIPNDVASGEAVMGPAIDFYAASKIAASGSDKLGYIEPAGQGVILPDPIGILRDAPHADLAKKFVDLVMSPAGQKIWMFKQGSPGGPQNTGLLRKAILPSMYQPLSPNSVMRDNPYQARNSLRYDSAKSTLRRRALDDLLGTVLVDNQDGIKALWERNPDAAKVAFVPVTEAELTALAGRWDDTATRNAAIARWNTAMRNHFKNH